MTGSKLNYYKLCNPIRYITYYSSILLIIILIEQIRDYVVFYFISKFEDISEAYGSFSMIYDMLVFNLSFAFTKAFGSEIVKFYINKEYNKIILLTNKYYYHAFSFAIILVIVMYYILDPILFTILSNKKVYVDLRNLLLFVSVSIPFSFLKMVNFRFLESINEIKIVLLSNILGLIVLIGCLYSFIIKLDYGSIGISLSIDISVFTSFLFQSSLTYYVINKQNWLEYVHSKSTNINNSNVNAINNTSFSSSNFDEEKINLSSYNTDFPSITKDYEKNDIKTVVSTMISNEEYNNKIDYKLVFSKGILGYMTSISFELSSFTAVQIGDKHYTLLNYLTNIFKILIIYPETISISIDNLIEVFHNYSNKQVLENIKISSEKILIYGFFTIFLFIILSCVSLNLYYERLLDFFTIDPIIIALSQEYKGNFIIAFVFLCLNPILSSCFEEYNKLKFTIISGILGIIISTIIIFKLIKLPEMGLNAIFISLISNTLILVFLNLLYLSFNTWFIYIEIFANDKDFVTINAIKELNNVNNNLEESKL